MRSRRSPRARCIVGGFNLPARSSALTPLANRTCDTPGETIWLECNETLVNATCPRAGEGVALEVLLINRVLTFSQGTFLAIFFGFGCPAIAQLIEQLPGAKACEGFGTEIVNVCVARCEEGGGFLSDGR